ncbi:MAG TPA: hypothetical protein VFU43_06465 [Streptosporangiaceae bacterium]|nr:hypothetical protein [Streptosporangiaceae bacterium]
MGEDQSGDNGDATKDRLDAAARSLLTSTALLTGLLAAFGLTSDRIPHLLDDATNAGWLLIIAGILVVATLGVGISALAIAPTVNNLAIRAYRGKDRIQIEGRGNQPVDTVDTDCASKNYRTAPGCIDVSLPTTSATPSPVPTR